MPEPLSSSIKLGSVGGTVGAVAGIFVVEFMVPALVGTLAMLAAIALVESDPPLTRPQVFRRVFGSAVISGFATRGTLALLSLDPLIYRELVAGIIGIAAAGLVAWLSDKGVIGGLLDTVTRSRGRDGDS